MAGRGTKVDDYYDDFSVGGDESDSDSSDPYKKYRSQRLHAFCKHLPKVELHSHLSGSIREATLRDLARQRGVQLNPQLHMSINQPLHSGHVGETKEEKEAHRSLMHNTKPRSLLECFEIFGEISLCVNDLPALRRITREALEDFANEHVAILELRSGPKQLMLDSLKGDTTLCTKRQYLETIIDVMRDFQEEERERYEKETNDGPTVAYTRLPLVPRLIVSVDRSGTLEQAQENVSVAIEMFNEENPFIVGVELGGNPTRNEFAMFLPAFEMARESGLKVAIHCGEVPCASSPSDDSDAALVKAYEEAKDIVEWRPDRLGHALLLPDSIMENLLNDPNPIPIETCPTSNVMTLELSLHFDGSLVEGLKMHPQLKKWLSRKHPISINTDDSGLFNTNPTRELLIVAKAHNLGMQELGDIVLNSTGHIFDSNATVLMKRVKARVKALLTVWAPIKER